MLLRPMSLTRKKLQNTNVTQANFSKAKFWEGQGVRGMSPRPIFFDAKINYNQNSKSNYDYGHSDNYKIAIMIC